MSNVISLDERRPNALERVIRLINELESGEHRFFRGVSGLELIEDGEVIAVTEYDHSKQQWVAERV